MNGVQIPVEFADVENVLYNKVSRHLYSLDKELIFCMDKKSLFRSTETLTGAGLIVAGLVSQIIGIHGIFAMALAPFGVGLILSDVLSHGAKAARSRVKMRRDDD